MARQTDIQIAGGAFRLPSSANVKRPKKKVDMMKANSIATIDNWIQVSLAYFPVPNSVMRSPPVEAAMVVA